MAETVEQPQPQPQKTFADGYMTFSSLSTLLAIIIGLFTLAGMLRKHRREAEADAQAREDRITATFDKHNDSVEDRLKTVEVTIRDFMPRAEIDRAIQHEKNNRVQVDEGQQRAIEALSRDTTDIKVELGRLRERNEGMANDLGEVKSLVKELARDTASRLDRMGEQIATLRH